MKNFKKKPIYLVFKVVIYSASLSVVKPKNDSRKKIVYRAQMLWNYLKIKRNKVKRDVPSELFLYYLKITIIKKFLSLYLSKIKFNLWKLIPVF